MNEPMHSTPERKYQPKRNSEGRRIARELMQDVTECQLKHLRKCRGPLDTAHLDGDELNNVRENLRKLCRSHHRLLDLQVISLDSTTMPKFRIRRDKGRHYGERVYYYERANNRARWRQKQIDRKAAEVTQSPVATPSFGVRQPERQPATVAA